MGKSSPKHQCTSVLTSASAGPHLRGMQPPLNIWADSDTSIAEPLSLKGIMLTPERLAKLEIHQQQQQENSMMARQMFYESLGAKLEKDQQALAPLTIPASNMVPTNGTKTKQRKSCTRWTAEEDILLTEAIRVMGAKNWNNIAKYVGTKNGDQCNQHWHRVLNPRISRTAWTKEEDQTLNKMVEEHGQSSWKKIAEFIPGRTDIQCRHRWIMLKKQAERAARAPELKLRKKKVSTENKHLKGLNASRERSMSDVLPRSSKSSIKKRRRAVSSARSEKAKNEVATHTDMMEEYMFDLTDGMVSEDPATPSTADSSLSFEFDMFAMQGSSQNSDFIGAVPSIPDDKQDLQFPPNAEHDALRAQISQIYDETLHGVQSPVQALLSPFEHFGRDISLDGDDDMPTELSVGGFFNQNHVESSISNDSRSQESSDDTGEISNDVFFDAGSGSCPVRPFSDESQDNF